MLPITAAEPVSEEKEETPADDDAPEAAAHGEHLDSDMNIVANARINVLGNVVQNGNTVAIIVVISMISVTAIGGYFFLRKRKEEI